MIICQIDYIDITHEKWDIICKPNPRLFTNGLNLVILEIPDNDITDNVNIICPTNHYSNELFDSYKNSLILVKQGSYYEPIYSYTNEETNLKIGKLFNEHSPN